MSSIAKSFPPAAVFVLKMLIVAVVLDPEFQIKECSTQVQAVIGAVAKFPTLIPLIITSNAAREPLLTTFVKKKLKV